MRYLISLIAAAAVAACSDTPVEPGSGTTTRQLVATLDVATSGTDSSTNTALADGAVAPADSTAPASTTPTASSALQPLYCPSSSDVRATRGWIGPDGGSLGFRGHELKVPAGAISEPTEFEIVVPVSDYMELEVHAVNRDGFLFAVPATITISFARCSSVPDSPLTAAYVDSAQRILQDMGGSTDRASKKVSFQTGHLSGFIVAY